MIPIHADELSIENDVFFFVGNITMPHSVACYEVWVRNGRYINDRTKRNECTCVVRGANVSEKGLEVFDETKKVIQRKEFFEWLQEQPYCKERKEVESKYWMVDYPNYEIEKQKEEKKKEKVGLLLGIIKYIGLIIYLLFYVCLVLLLTIIAPRAVKSLPKLWK